MWWFSTGIKSARAELLEVSTDHPNWAEFYVHIWHQAVNFPCVSFLMDLRGRDFASSSSPSFFSNCWCRSRKEPYLESDIKVPSVLLSNQQSHSTQAHTQNHGLWHRHSWRLHWTRNVSFCFHGKQQKLELLNAIPSNWWCSVIDVGFMWGKWLLRGWRRGLQNYHQPSTGLSSKISVIMVRYELVSRLERW